VNSKTKYTTVSAAILTLMMGTAHAKDDDDSKLCTDKTLIGGVYLFHASGFSISPTTGVAQPKAIVEMFRFDADGKLTGGVATVSVNGTVFHSAPTAPGVGGTYTFADCIGTITFPTGPTFDFYLVNKSEIQMIQTNPNTVFQGTAERLTD
jgi:hypothetical protein